MSVIRVPTNKSLELVDLEAHVTLCEQRRKSSDERISYLENKFSILEEQERTSRRFILASLITVATGVLTTLLAVILRYYFQ